MGALQDAGFCECKHVVATSRRASRPAGGAWQGVDPRTGSTASLVWMAHAVTQDAMVFIEIDGVTMVSPRREPDADGSRG